MASENEDRSSNVDEILDQAAAGDEQAAADLLPMVYSQLRAVAQQRMMSE